MVHSARNKTPFVRHSTFMWIMATWTFTHFHFCSLSSEYYLLWAELRTPGMTDWGNCWALTWCFFNFTRKGLERTPDQPKQSKAPFSNRLGPMIMGTGIFIVLCGLTYMLEVKDSKNRHFIIGDCYNNFIYNVDPSRSNQPLKKLRYTLVFKIIYTNYLQLLADNCEYNASNLDTAWSWCHVRSKGRHGFSAKFNPPKK